MYPQEYASYYSNNKATYGFSEGFRTFRFWSHEKFFKIERSSADTVKIVENSVCAEIYCWALLYTQHTYGLTQLRFLPIFPYEVWKNDQKHVGKVSEGHYSDFEKIRKKRNWVSP